MLVHVSSSLIFNHDNFPACLQNLLSYKGLHTYCFGRHHARKPVYVTECSTSQYIAKTLYTEKQLLKAHVWGMSISEK